ncbi:MAG: hypothetical protein K5669_05605 [Lachnospiraceae bacterium]|nr:hypothetical protein [Lachnospiraceae bacterium]
MLLNLALIAPIAVMVKGERGFAFGKVPAIALAAYTFYRLTFSIINLNKSRKQYNCLVKELRAINTVDALVAVLSTQNALIIANGDMHEGFNLMSSYTSAVIYAVIVFVTIRSMIVNRE